MSLRFALSAAVALAVAGPLACTADTVTPRGVTPPVREASSPLAGGGYPVVVREIGDTPLFADEDSRVRAALVSWLASNTPWKIVPSADVERVRARALMGQDVASGAACGSPVHPHDAYERAFGEHDVAEASVRCERSCALELHVYRRPPGRPRFGEDTLNVVFSAPIDGAVTEASLIAAARRLRHVEPSSENGSGGLAIAPPRPIRQRAAVRVSLWSNDDPTASAVDDHVLTRAQSLFNRCYVAGGEQEMLVLSVNEGGHVERCEGRPWSAAPSRACVCDAMGHVPWPARAFRRGFDVVHEDPDVQVGPQRVVTAYFDEPAQRETQPWLAGWARPPSAVVAPCFVRERPASDFRVDVTWAVGADGKARSAAAAWSAGYYPGRETRACVENALGPARFPCPSHEREAWTVTSALHVLTRNPSTGPDEP